LSNNTTSSKTTGAFDLARDLEQSGQIRAAYTAYLQLGAVDEAARVLAGLGHFSHAARLLLSHLNIGPRDVGALPEAKHRSALHAAIYAEKAGQIGLAVDLFLALGKRERAVRALERTGNIREAKKIRSGVETKSLHPGGFDQTHAGQAAAIDVEASDLKLMRTHVQAGRPAEAMHLAKQYGRIDVIAELFVEAGMSYQAAKCYLELGDAGTIPGSVRSRFTAR